MNSIMDETGKVAGGSLLLAQKTVVAEIQRSIRQGYHRLLVLGPPHSRRLEAVRSAFATFRTEAIVIELLGVRTRYELDVAFQRATGANDFYGGMRKLMRLAQRRRIAVVFHNLDGCSGLPCEEYVVYRVWMEARHHCGATHVVFTARDPEFVARCFERYERGRNLVYPINLASDSPWDFPGEHSKQGGML